MGDFVTITKKEYLRLLIDSEKLCRLEGGGVDNWDWYSESLYPEDELGMDEWEEQEANRIAGL